MFCDKCGKEIKTHESVCPYCQQVFVPEEEPLLVIETGLYILSVYSTRTTVVDVRQQSEIYVGGFFSLLQMRLKTTRLKKAMD